MSKDFEKDVAFIRALAELLRETDLAEVEVEREYGDNDELKVRLSRQAAGAQISQAPFASPLATGPHAQPQALPTSAPGVSGEAEDPALNPGALASPMVGTVYLAPEPGAPAFVRVGEQVAEGQTVLIVEAMKTMNQIHAPWAGVVKQILVEDTQAVEFGAPLMIIE